MPGEIAVLHTNRDILRPSLVLIRLNTEDTLGMPLDLPSAVITDLAFGTGYNLIAAVSKAVTINIDKNNESQNVVVSFFEEIFGSIFT